MTTAAASPSPRPLALLDTLRDRLGAVPLSLMLLIARLGIGSVFLKAGLLKYQSWQLTLLLFRDEYKVPLVDPALMAKMATFNELTFST
ncbi:MAG: DoxX family protein, partial [Vicinamibacterales bacterium]